MLQERKQEKQNLNTKCYEAKRKYKMDKAQELEGQTYATGSF